jgi:RNA polymerase sigma-70 factor (ECF subfamily)
VNIWRHAADYQAERGAPLTWMAAIVRHRALDILRRERRGSAHEDLSAVENMPDSAPDPMMQTLLSAEARAIRNCLGALEERPQQCIILAFFHGYTHEELAARLGVPVGTVKSWIRRGLQRVKRCLES